MSEFMGVTHLVNLMHQEVYGRDLLKQEALIFDKLVIANLRVFLGNRKTFKEYLKDIDWLMEQEIVVGAEELLEGKQLVLSLESEIYHQLTHLQFELVKRLERRKRKKEKQKTNFISMTEKASDDEARWLSLLLRQSLNLEAYPVTTQNPVPPVRSTKGDVVEIILKKLPVPDDKTPWEQILEFRSDPDSRNKFLGLREWASEVARMKLNPNEVEQKLESLVSSYEEHMKLHKIKTRWDSIKTIVLAEAGFITGGWLTGLGALPGIAGMIATPLYSIKQRNISLAEEERKAPGKEIAYIIKAKRNFGS